MTLDLSPRSATVRERMIDRLPPQSLEAEQSVLGAILIDRDAVVEVAEFLRARRLLSPGERIDLRGGPRALRAARADRHRHGFGDARAKRAARGDRRAGLPVEPLQLDADGRSRRAVRADRRAQGGPPQSHRRGRSDRRHRLRGSGGGPGGDRSGRGGAVRGQPEAGRCRLLEAGLAPPPGLRPARLPPRPPRRDQRRPDRLHGPRRTHDRSPEERPDHRRGAAVGRQDELRAQHRRARRGQARRRASASSASR